MVGWYFFNYQNQVFLEIDGDNNENIFIFLRLAAIENYFRVFGPAKTSIDF